MAVDASGGHTGRGAAGGATGSRECRVCVRGTVRDGVLEIAFKKSAGDLGADFLGEIRNRPRFLNFPLGKRQKAPES